MTDEYKKAKNYLYRLLARRDYSQVEIKKKFASRETPKDVVDALLDEFVEKNYQSDYRFAEIFIRNKISKGYGPRKILAELSPHKISESVYQQIIKEEEVDWFDCIHKVYNKKYTDLTIPNLEYQKRYRFFLNRGFEPYLINQLFAEFK